MRKAFCCIGVLLLLAAAALGWLWHEASTFLAKTPESPGHTVLFDVPPGARFGPTAKRLAEKGIVTDALRFELLARWKKQENRLQAGRFALHTGWQPEHVLDALVNGKPALSRITVPEGLAWWQTARLLADAGFVKYEDFRAIITDPAFLRHYGIPFASAEGFLMPDTYLLKKPDDPAGDAPAGETPREGASTGNGASGPSANAPAASSGQQPAAATQVSVPDAAGSQQATTSPATGANAAAQQKAKPSPLPAEPGLRQAWRVAGRMVDNFWRKAEAVWPGGRRPAPGELKRWVILASIVEKETAVEAERPRVAGVYANRLAKGMLLQADPTVIYGLGQKFSGRLLYKHLDDATNPYNTYQRPGLTPGPICSFGASALGAAVKPETHAYLYFVAKPDGSGAHVFSTNLDAHNRAVREYREKRRGEKR